MFCKHCGHELSDTDKFCGYCGQPVENSEQTEDPKAENPDFQIPHIEEPEKISQPIVKAVAAKPAFLVFTIAFTVSLASFAISVFSGSILQVLPLIFGIFVDIALWTLYGLAKKENENENPALFNKIRSYAVCQKVFAIIRIVGLAILVVCMIALTVLVGTNLSKIGDFDISSSDKIKDSLSELVSDSGLEEIYGESIYDDTFDMIDELYEDDTISEILTLGIGTILMIVTISLTVVTVVALVVEVISAVRYKKMALFCDDLRLSWISGVPMRGEHTGLRKLSIVYGVLRAISVFGIFGLTIIGGGFLSGIVSIGGVVAIFAFASIVKELDNGMKEAAKENIA